MKELSIEQKARRYDEAIERAKKVLLDCTPEEQKVVEYISPELKESEDERFKEELKEVLDECLNVRPQIVEEKQYMRIIAWLEKQSKQKPIIDNKDAEKAAEEYRNFRISCGIKDPVMLNEIEEAYYEGAIRKQKTVEWSEEDENNIINICAHLRDVLTDDALKKYRNWFKFLKDRVQPQPKHEWNEEDEKTFNDICIDIMEYIPKSFEENSKKINWLKSICYK